MSTTASYTNSVRGGTGGADGAAPAGDGAAFWAGAAPDRPFCPGERQPASGGDPRNADAFTCRPPRP